MMTTKRYTVGLDDWDFVCEVERCLDGAGEPDYQVDYLEVIDPWGSSINPRSISKSLDWRAQQKAIEEYPWA